jgi:hypothetical protein
MEISYNHPFHFSVDKQLIVGKNSQDLDVCDMLLPEMGLVTLGAEIGHAS